MCHLAPVKVSPLIRATRWTFFIAGIFYGFSKHQLYSEQQKTKEEKVKLLEYQKESALEIEKIKTGEFDISSE